MSQFSGESHAAPTNLGRRLASGTFWTVAGRVASVGSLLGINAVVRRGVGDADYAAYAIASALAILLSIFASAGAPKVLLRAIRDPRVNDPGVLRRCLSNGFSLVPVACCLGSITIYVAGHLTGDSGKWRALQDYPILTSLWMSGYAVSFVQSHALQGFDCFWGATLVGSRAGGVVANVAAFMACCIAYAGGFVSLTTVLVVQGIANGLAVALGALLLRRELAKREATPWTVADLGFEHSMPADPAEENIGRESGGSQDPLFGSRRWFLSEGFSNMLVQITSTSIVQVEMLIMGAFADERNIADYNIVLRLLEVLAAVHILATTIVAPFIAELYARGDTRRLEMLLRGLASLVAVPTTILLLGFWIMPEIFLRLMSGDEMRSAAWTLRIASLAAAISCYAGANALTMVMTGRQRTLLRASVVAAGFQLLIAPVLISSFGALGAATTTLVVFGAYNIVVTLLVRRDVGVWTTPSLSVNAWKSAWQLLMRRLEALGNSRSIGNRHSFEAAGSAEIRFDPAGDSGVKPQ